MKILMTTDNIGGVWTFALSLAVGMRKKGVEVILAIIGNPLSKSQIKQLKDIRFYHRLSKQEWMDEPWEDLRETGQWLLRLQDIVRADIVHLNSYAYGSLRWRVPVIVTLHSCVLTWWQAVKNEPAPQSYDIYREIVTLGIRSAAVVTAPGNVMMNTAEEYYGPFRRKKVIYNGLDPDNFRKTNKVRMLFSMGRMWDEGKNCSLILDAADDIRYPIYIAGDDDHLRNRQLPSHVHLRGVLPPEEIVQYLAQAPIFALPVKYEPFGYTFLEAAFSGCALIGGDIASLREIWGDAMLFVDPQNARHLASTVNYLMKNDGIRVAYAERALARAWNFTLARMVKEYHQLYVQVAQNKLKSVSV
jgi:glycosyltransferase involved in cell wall biosynthesis